MRVKLLFLRSLYHRAAETTSWSFLICWNSLILSIKDASFPFLMSLTLAYIPCTRAVPLLCLFNEICYLPKESPLYIQTQSRKITNMHMAVSTDLFPGGGIPLNLSRSLALASSTAPGSLSFSVNLGLLVLLKISVLALLLETN